MSEHTENAAPPDESPNHSSEVAEASVSARFFERTDWVSFGVTTILVLAVYLWTLAPDVTLEMSGELSVAASYAGVPHPPGFPVWTIYAWLFTKLLPFSNIAWRVAVSSAVAGASACGLIALVVSRGGRPIIEWHSGCNRPAPEKERQLCVVGGAVAGLGFGFDKWFWQQAIIVDTWALGVLMLSLSLALLMKWFYAPEQKRYLYAAFLVCGLTFSSHQLLFAAAFGLEVIVMCADANLRRDLCFANSLLFFAGLIANGLGGLPVLDSRPPHLNLLWLAFFGVGIGSIAMCILQTVRTRRFLTEGKAVLAMGAMFLLGLTPHVYLPIASMTTPPANWSYSRTVEGFWHMVTRGQFERIHPTQGFGAFFQQLGIFGEFVVKDLGWFYVIAALIPLCFLHRMQSQARRWLLGTLAVFLCLSLLVLLLLNLPPDRQAGELVAHYFTASHLVVATWAGYGLILLGTIITREKST